MSIADDLFADWADTLRDQYRPDGECAEAVALAASKANHPTAAAPLAAYMTADEYAAIVPIKAARSYRARHAGGAL